MIEATVSIGIATFPDHGHHREELLANADLAMYRAKSDGGTSYCVFDAEMDEFIRERRKIAHEFRVAMNEGEFELYCQPQHRTDTEELVGFEILLRWNSPSRGIVPPMEFILIAEETGIIKDIDEWVMRQACERPGNGACPSVSPSTCRRAPSATRELPTRCAKFLSKPACRPAGSKLK